MPILDRNKANIAVARYPHIAVRLPAGWLDRCARKSQIADAHRVYRMLATGGIGWADEQLVHLDALNGRLEGRLARDRRLLSRALAAFVGAPFRPRPARPRALVRGGRPRAGLRRLRPCLSPAEAGLAGGLPTRRALSSFRGLAHQHRRPSSFSAPRVMNLRPPPSACRAALPPCEVLSARTARRNGDPVPRRVARLVGFRCRAPIALGASLDARSSAAAILLPFCCHSPRNGRASGGPQRV